MLDAPTMRGLAACAPLRVRCSCGAAREITVAEKHLDTPVRAFARALRCADCGYKGGKSLVGTWPEPRPAPIARVERKPQKRLDFIGLAFAIADRENRAKIEAIHGPVFELSADDRERLATVRALLGWDNA